MKPKVNRWFDRERVQCVPKVGPEVESFVVQQQFKRDCDINEIVKNALRGQPPAFVRPDSPSFGDFVGFGDLTEMFGVVEAAREAFEALPIELRKELDHDPRNFDRLTREDLVRHGLLKAQETPEDGSGSSPTVNPEGTTQSSPPKPPSPAGG